jgi:uncharacterized Zn finger protein
MNSKTTEKSEDVPADDYQFKCPTCGAGLPGPEALIHTGHQDGRVEAMFDCVECGEASKVSLTKEEADAIVRQDLLDSIRNEEEIPPEY